VTRRQNSLPSLIPFVETLDGDDVPGVGDFGKVWSITKNEDRQRAEFARMRNSDGSMFEFVQGEEYYLGWRWRINDNDAITEDVTVFQWKTRDVNDPENTQNYPIAMEYDGTKLKLTLYAPNVDKDTGEQINTGIQGPRQEIRGSVFARSDTIWEREILEDRWVDLVLRVKYDRGTNGEVSLWYRGAQQRLTNTGDNYQAPLSTDRRTAFHQTMDGNHDTTQSNYEPPIYPKWGVYNGNSCPWKVQVFLDEMRLADSFTDANPDTHNDPG
jgi:hypothetical protein